MLKHRSNLLSGGSYNSFYGLLFILSTVLIEELSSVYFAVELYCAYDVTTRGNLATPVCL